MLFFSSISDWLLEHNYGFKLMPFSMVFACLTLFTLIVVGKFSKNYLEGEVGERRFWLLYVFFASGMLISCFSANLKTFYIGWEIVGLASFFLIGFYQTNTRSVENSMIALSNYKICDLFFVMAIFLEEANYHTACGFFLIIATLAKSAQLPFSSWLYRALEGPTPSSTLFYGGLSLHLGAFVLLQFSNLWDHAVGLRILVAVIGFSSALFGFLVGSVRSDLKTSFAFASISQVGLIYLEMSLGFYKLAMLHIIGHNLLRTWNYLRGMSFFDDFFKEEYHQKNGAIWDRFFKALPKAVFFHSMNGFYLDYISIVIKRWGFLIFMGFGLFGLATEKYEPVAFLILSVALISSVTIFFVDRLKPMYFLMGLIVSQIFILFSIHSFFEDQLEHLYLFVSFVSLGLLVFSLLPGIKEWIKRGNLSYESQQFLGFAKKFPKSHALFLVSALLITGSPATFEFFIQEGVLDEIWLKSHMFFIVLMVCVTLNTVHTFKIGQAVFLGDER